MWLQQQRIAAAPATARVVSVRRVTAPDGIAQQTSYAIERPGCPTRHLTRTVVVRPVGGRPLDPNLPPTYNQAVSGSDRSVKVEDGTTGATVPPESGDPSAPPPEGPPPGFTNANVGPAAPPPPAYSSAPTAVSFPPPAAVIRGRSDSDEDDGIDDDDRRLLLA